jgi:hypothetical protein
MKPRSFAMLLAAASLAACESSPTAPLDQQIRGTWMRTETFPTTTDSSYLAEIWWFDGTYYSRSITELPKAGGNGVGVLTEMGTYTVGSGRLRLVRQQLFERQPGTSPAAGGPGTEMKPVTPVSITTRAVFRGGRLVLGADGCTSGTACIPGPFEYGAMLVATS